MRVLTQKSNVLGHIITKNRILPEPTKLNIVDKFSVPKILKTYNLL